MSKPESIEEAMSRLSRTFPFWLVAGGYFSTTSDSPSHSTLLTRACVKKAAYAGQSQFSAGCKHRAINAQQRLKRS